MDLNNRSHSDNHKSKAANTDRCKHKHKHKRRDEYTGTFGRLERVQYLISTQKDVFGR